jgi:S-adenosylmethionine hydrolase
MSQKFAILITLCCVVSIIFNSCLISDLAQSPDKQLYLMIENSSKTDTLEILIYTNQTIYDTISLMTITDNETQKQIVKSITFEDSINILILDNKTKTSFYKTFRNTDIDNVIYVLGSDEFVGLEPNHNYITKYAIHFSLMRQINNY